MSAQQVVFQYLSAGSNTLTVPPGFSNQVLVYAWGGGGGSGYNGPAGGGGGFVQGIVTVSSGDTVVISVGGQGGVGPRDGSGIGGIGDTPAISFNGGTSGVGAPTDHNDDQNYGAGGGGGAATSVLVNGIPMIVAAGGGGGGGGTSYQTGAVGYAGGTLPDTEQTLTALVVLDPRTGSSNHGYYIRDAGDRTSPSSITGARQYIVRLNGITVWDSRSPPPNNYQPSTYRGSVYGIRDNGGITTSPAQSPYGDVLSAFDLILPGGPGLNTTQSGGMSRGGYSVGGGGGAGYPFGGAGGASYGDDAGNAGGGGGGQNYANASVTSSTLTAGSGITPGGVTNVLYPKAKRGYAGYDGAVIVIFTKSFRAWIKDTDWKEVNNAWVKIPSSSTTVYRTIPPTTTIYENSGTTSFVVPPGVFSIDASVTGGSGGGGGGGAGAGQPGGTSYKDIRTITVIPGETITITVGAGGQGGRSGTSNCGSNGVNWHNINNDPSSRRGQGGAGYASGGAGDGAGCYGSGQPDGGWAGGGGGSSALTYSGGTVIAGGGAGGNGGARPVDGATGTGGTAGNPTVGNQGATGAAGGAGLPAQYGATYGGRGGAGVVTLSYRSETIAEIVTTGGWKPITQAWIKADDVWKPIQSGGVSLVPIPSTSEVVTINLNIAANANNYVLSDFLSATSYYPGRSIINLTVNAGVIVGSGSVGTPALIIDGLTVGDTITLTNNGTIQGRGGNGGAAGSYSSVTSGGSPATSNSCFLPGTLVSTPDGYVTIETIQVGDLVYAYNINSEFNNSAVLEPKTVTKTYEHTWEEANKVTPLLIITHSQGELIVTPEHELLCLDKVDPNSDYPGFVRADALAVGDIIYAEDGSELTITDIANGPEHYEYVYNIEVDDYHTYVANGIRVHNGTQAPRGNYSVGTTVITSNPGQPGAAGGIALEVQYTTTLVNNSIIAGGGGGGGGGGGTTGGQGGGGAGYGSGANNGTVSAGGAGTGYGGAGGARGVSGTSGTNDTNNGGVGGDPGAAIKGITNVTINTAGTITGPRIV